MGQATGVQMRRSLVGNRLVNFVRGATRFRQVVHLDFIRIELCCRLRHAIERIIERQRRGIFGTEANGIHSGDDEALQVGTGQPFGLEGFDLFDNLIVELQEGLARCCRIASASWRDFFRNSSTRFNTG